MFEILETVENWLQQGRKIALATVVDTWGSAPRGRGSKMAVTETMGMIGSVSGGCVENAVIQEALESLKDGKPRFLKYGVSDDTAWSVGLTCGGKIAIYVEPLDVGWWQLASSSTRQNQHLATVTIVEGDAAGQKIVVNHEIQYATPALSPELQAIFSQLATATPATQHTTAAEYEVLVDVIRPSPRLVIIGGVHVAMPLQLFARQLGFQVFLIDPRKAFATAERFPDVTAIYHTYPDKALPEIGLDQNSYVAVLTHDPKIDDRALKAALPSPAPYVGVLSSQKTHERRMERLTKAGLTSEQIGRIYTPVGIDIGAKTPEEIALCIMAEIIAVRNGGALMKFGDVPLSEAVDNILAHNIIGQEGRKLLGKGHILTPEDITLLTNLGWQLVTVAQLENTDLSENEAARRVGQALAGEHIKVAAPGVGRANLTATQKGVLRVNVAALTHLNNIDEGITIATLREHTLVDKGDLVTLVKIIPFAIQTARVMDVEASAREAAPILSIRPLKSAEVGLILSGPETIRNKQIAEFGDPTRQRLEKLGSHLAEIVPVPHSIPALCEALRGQVGAGRDLIMVAGVSAIIDRQDVVPSALQAAGGSVAHFGVPVDPGSLLMLGYMDTIPVIGAPGCIKSLKTNVIDWILPRLLAGERLTRADLVAMGHGGLLEDISERPMPRQK